MNSKIHFDPRANNASRSAMHCLAALSLTLVLCPDSALSQGSSGTLLTTIHNPTPANLDVFGGVVAPMGNDRVLIGAEGASAAYLYSLDGALLKTFTIPDPAAVSFGAALVALGNDRVLISAYSYEVGVSQVGRTYLFDTNGALLATFTNPSPASVQAFGFSVATVGSDRVLIGSGGGGPYLFDTNGALLTTFTKPTPGGFNNFGTSMVAVGNDRVLVGAQDDSVSAASAGAAYLFRTNGTLLTTFTNPAPVSGDNFGTSVALLGSDRVLISAIDYGGVKGTGGTAYMFGTNGTLITTFTNPTPAASDFFGYSVAVVGTDRVLIGAYQDNTGAFQAGAAYLFDTNGALRNTYVSPEPAAQGWFAYSVAAAGSNQVIIGAVWDNTGAPQAGSAYLFLAEDPPLRVIASALNQNDVVATFNAVTGKTYRLERKLALTDPNWESILGVDDLTAVGVGQAQISDPGAAVLDHVFYRLRVIP